MTQTALAITDITSAQIGEVAALWQRCGLTRPWNDPEHDIHVACRGDNATVLVGTIDDRITATVMVGHDGHRGWVYYLAVDPDVQRTGHGRTMMQAAEEWLRQRGLEKLQLMVRAEKQSVHQFYESIGYGVQERVIFARWLDGRPLTP